MKEVALTLGSTPLETRVDFLYNEDLKGNIIKLPKSVSIHINADLKQIFADIKYYYAAFNNKKTIGIPLTDKNNEIKEYYERFLVKEIKKEKDSEL